MERIEPKEKLLLFLKKYRYALLVLMIGLVLMCLPGSRKETSPTVTSTQTEKPSVTMEQQLEAILSQIQGAGKVKVMLPPIVIPPRKALCVTCSTPGKGPPEKSASCISVVMRV